MAWQNNGANKAPSNGNLVTVNQGDQAYLSALNGKAYIAREWQLSSLAIPVLTRTSLQRCPREYLLFLTKMGFAHVIVFRASAGSRSVLFKEALLRQCC